MSNENVEHVVNFLLEVYDRPTLYMREASAVQHFLDGFRCGCFLFGVEREPDLFYQVVEERGWEREYFNWEDMKRTLPNKDDVELAREFITVEIEVLKRTYGLSD